MEKRIFLFMDVDGVLIRGYSKNPALQRPWDKDIQRDLGICPQALSEHFFAKKFRAVLQGKADLITELNSTLPLLPYKGQATDIISYWFKGDAAVDGRLMNAVLTFKKKAACPLYLATNQEKRRAAYLWNELGFKNIFDGIFYSAQLGCMKDDLDFFAKINNKLSLDPVRDNILFFDDDEQYIRCAQEAGWNAYLYETFASFADCPYICKFL